MSVLTPEKAGSIQLALFEIIWPSFLWVVKIYLGFDQRGITVHTQVDVSPSNEEWDDYERLLGEILSAAFEAERYEYHLTQSTGSPLESHFELLMSQAQFEALAKRYAPWRLEAGR